MNGFPNEHINEIIPFAEIKNEEEIEEKQINSTDKNENAVLKIKKLRKKILFKQNIYNNLKNECDNFNHSFLENK